MITQAELKEYLNYDENTGIFTWKVSPSCAVKAGMIAGGTRKDRYTHIKILGRFYLAHRLAWLYMYGHHPEKHIDHINGIRADNRISNLRLCTFSQNQQNLSKLRDNNTSGLLGVSYYKITNKWKAQICLNKKYIFLGYFDDKESAYKAYLKKKKELHEYSTM